MHTLQKHTILLITILLWSCISVFASERTSPQYHYHITDHQGNIRLVANTAGTAEQVTHYYPYGLPFAESQNAHLQPYKYNSKELDMTNNLYDYGARHYDAALCRWNGMDALAEKYISVSPYNYCSTNPITRVDVDGNGWYSTTDDKENVIYNYNAEINTKEDFEKSGLQGIFLGLTYQKADNYYSLFGSEENLRTVQGIVTKKIDEAIIKQIEYDNRVAEQYNNPSYFDEQIEQPTTDFFMKIKSKETSFNIKYANSDYGVYSVAPDNRRNNRVKMQTPIEGIFKSTYGDYLNGSLPGYWVIMGNGLGNRFDNVKFRFNENSKSYTQYLYKLNLIRKSVK